MDAPKKIYFTGHHFFNERLRDTDVEYTRSDAFIEKAVEWIKNKAENYIVDTPLCSYFDYKRAVEEFKKAMKL